MLFAPAFENKCAYSGDAGSARNRERTESRLPFCVSVDTYTMSGIVPRIRMMRDAGNRDRHFWK